jgi:Predicted endonuclease containing a URI domain
MNTNKGFWKDFTRKYNVHKLVYFESCGEATDAISREKQIKRWSRTKKNALVESKNPNWEEITI